MNRRELLNALGALSVVGVLQGCTHGDTSKEPPPSKETKNHTLQILLEGAFAVVLQEQSQRLTAFVPLPDPDRKDLEHYFCFNDPEQPKKLSEKTKEFHFELSGEGLHTYYSQDQKRNINPYVNPGFADFSAEVDKWFLPPSLVVLDLPFPRSINFGGRPLDVRFGKKALKPFGKMPTNYILEYRVDEQQKVKLKCNQGDMQCSPSPHCPPGVLRYFFGVGPINHDPQKREEHAIEFFNNVILKKAFPELQENMKSPQLKRPIMKSLRSAVGCAQWLSRQMRKSPRLRFRQFYPRQGSTAASGGIASGLPDRRNTSSDQDGPNRLGFNPY